MRAPLPLFVKAWFALDLFFALWPPVHWTASRTGPILEIPGSLLYLFGLGTFIALSVAVAFFYDNARRPGKMEGC